MKFLSFLYNLLINNFFLKLLAMFLTLVVWFIMLSSKEVEANKKIKIRYITPTGFTVAEAPQSITVKLKGPKVFIDEIMRKEKSIAVDLRNKKTGFISYTVPKEEISLPINVEVLDIEPKVLLPKIEKLLSKEVNLKASLVGNLPDTYQLNTIKLTPAKLDISGPESYVKRITEIETAPIDISNLKGSTSLKTTIDKEFLKKFPYLKQKTISVYLDISPVMLSKIYRKIPIIVKGINHRRFRINPKRVDIVLKGPKLILDSLEELDIKASIDITFNTKGSFKEEISVELPENISLISVNPRKISVWIY